MKKILFITALFSISLFSCNSNKSSSQVYDIDPGLDSLCYTEKLVTNLTRSGIFKCISRQIEITNSKQDSILSSNEHKFTQWILRSEFSDVSHLVIEEIHDLNFNTLTFDRKDELGGGCFEEKSPWMLDTIDGSEYSSCIYKIDKTNIAVHVATLEDISSKNRGTLVFIVEVSDYWNNPNFDLSIFDQIN